MTHQKITGMARRLVNLYRSADPSAVAAGLDWYRRAGEIARELDPADPDRAAAVIAALSPRLTWTANVAGARALYAANASYAPGLPGQRAKARAILAGADPDAVLKGPKERAFWRNIAGDPDAVTVDMWAIAAALGVPADAPEVRKGNGHRPTTEAVAAAYRRAAATLDIPPRDLQAAAWVAVRGRA